MSSTIEVVTGNNRKMCVKLDNLCGVVSKPMKNGEIAVGFKPHFGDDITIKLSTITEVKTLFENLHKGWNGAHVRQLIDDNYPSIIHSNCVHSVDMDNLSITLQLCNQSLVISVKTPQQIQMIYDIYCNTMKI